MTPFYRDSLEDPPKKKRSQKSESSTGCFQGRFPPPPLAFSTFWPPLSWSPMVSLLCSHSSCRNHTMVGIPPAWQRSQSPSRLKKSKKSLRESLRGGLRGSWPTPPKRVKNESPESKNGLAESPRDSFLTRFGGGVGQDPWRPPSETLQETLFWLFEPGRVLTPLPGGGDPNTMENRKPIKKCHIKEFGGRNALGASRGQIRDVPGTLCGNSHSRGRMSAGQTGQMTGQMGHKPQGVPPQNSLCLFGFFLSQHTLPAMEAWKMFSCRLCAVVLYVFGPAKACKMGLS